MKFPFDPICADRGCLRPLGSPIDRPILPQKVGAACDSDHAEMSLTRKIRRDPHEVDSCWIISPPA